VRDLAEGSGGNAETGDETLLDKAVLGDGQRPRPWRYRHAVRKITGRAVRDVFEFEGDQIAGSGQGPQGLPVVVARAGACGGHVEGARLSLVRIDMDLEAEPGRGEGQHAAQLAAAKNPDGGPGWKRAGKDGRSAHGLRFFGFLPPGVLAPDRVCLTRQASSRRPSFGSSRARRAAAKSPAFFAPASPMAKVATGMPPGIWAMESRLSSPLSARVSTGTPSTGKTVIEA